MPKFSANLTIQFNEVDFLDRFARARQAGFAAVEYMFPYEWPKEQLAELLTNNGLSQILHNLPAGDWAAGERGIACLPGREAEFQAGVGKAIEYAKALSCGAINCLVGLTPLDHPADSVYKTLVNNLKFATRALADEGIQFLVEALNDRDIPGFHLVHTQDVLNVMDAVDHPNIRLQYDIYHMQRMEGELTATITKHIDRIGHIQLADNPGRHEPGTGEINYTNLLRAIDDAGYTGWIGCEYIPAGTTEAGLGWMDEYQ